MPPNLEPPPDDPNPGLSTLSKIPEPEPKDEADEAAEADPPKPAEG